MGNQIVFGQRETILNYIHSCMKVYSKFILPLILFLTFSSNVFSQSFSGGNGTPDDPWQIYTASELDSVRHYLHDHFILMANIDLDIAPYNTGLGWEPIGYNVTNDTTSRFTGSFNGAGHTISGLYIHREGSNLAGLFGYIQNGSITNISLSQVEVFGKKYVGSLTGISFKSDIDSSNVTGIVSGSELVGGLTGTNFTSSLSNSSANVQVIGSGDYIGGLAGENVYNSIISNSYSGGSGARVEGQDHIGGLVGYNDDSSIINSYATSSVLGVRYVGGLIGSSAWSQIQISYSAGSVSGNNDIAGFIGQSEQDTLNLNYWNKETSGQQTGVNIASFYEEEAQEDEIASITSVQMTNPENFINWDFETIWNINTGESYPWLRWQAGPHSGNQPSYGPPRNLHATVVTDTADLSWEIELSWRPPSTGLPVSYNIYRSGKLLHSVDIENTANPTASDTSWADTSANNFIQYTYYITAVYDTETGELESSPSNQVQEIVLTGLRGSGTENDPWLISTLRELNALSIHTSAHFKLVKDIDLTLATSENTGIFWHHGLGWEPITGFEGSLDGNGHILSGLYINRLKSSNVGFFSTIDTAIIKNLSLTDVNIKGSINVGGLAGMVKNSSITNISVTGTIDGVNDVGGLAGTFDSSSLTGSFTIGHISGEANVGGLTGMLQSSSSISKSYSLANTYGRDRIGGLIGEINNSTIDHSYAAGRVEGQFETAGIAGFQLESTFNSNFWDIETTEQQYGVNNSNGVGTNGLSTSEMLKSASYSGWDFETVWDITSEQTYPWLRAYPQNPPPVPVNSNRSVPFPAGSGTVDDPWEITTAALLDSLRNYLKGHFILTTDINLDIPPYNQGKGWKPIAQNNSYTDFFKGSFDGNDHTISGLYINRPDEYHVGLFGYIGSFATIQDLGLVKIDVTGGTWVGGLAGTLYASTVSNTYTTGRVKGKDVVGGFVGNHFSNNSYIRTSYANVQVSATENVGGFTGTNAWEARIFDSYSLGSVQGEEWVGGFTGSNRAASITRSYSAGKVSAESAEDAGGFIGFAEEEILNRNYWALDSSDFSSGIGNKTVPTTQVSGLSSDQMRQPDSFNSWNFSNTWDIEAGNSYPWLRALPQDPAPGLLVDLEKELPLPDRFELAQNYPNPFNPSTVIRYQLPVNSDVRLQVFNVLGKKIATLVDGKVEAGYHEVTFNAGSLASGIFFYRLKAGNTVFIKKLTLIK